MQYVTLISGRSWSIVQQALVCLILFAFMMATELFVCPSSPHAAGKVRYIPKRYTLSGEIGLAYEKRWAEHTDTDLERFTHHYDLGLSGFIIDPRLMTFDIDSTFSQEINKPGDNIDSYGFDASLNVLNKPARRGFFSHFPQPIIFTFSNYETGDSMSNGYGISFGYDPFEPLRIHRQFQQQQQQQQFRRQQQIMQQTDENDGQQMQDSRQRQINTKMQKKIFPILLPVMFVDYNIYSYTLNASSSNSEVDSEFLNIRLVDRNNKTDFQTDYNYQSTERSNGEVTKSESQYLVTEVNYRDYWKEKQERFDSYNELDIRDFDNRRTLELSSNSIWDKRLGKDLKDQLTISGGGLYFTSDNEDTSDNYRLIARSEYTKNFIKMWNRSDAEVNYGDSGLDDIYLARFINETNYDLSKRLSLNGRLRVGLNELGELYGAGAGIGVRTFIDIMPRYDYNRNAASEGMTDTHDFNLDLTGRIYRAMTFNSRNSYIIRKVSGSNPFEEKILDLRADFFWILRDMNITLGAARVETENSERDIRRSEGGVVSGEEAVKLGVTSVYANLSAPVSRNAFLTLNSNYTNASNQKTLNIRPIFTWNLRQVTLTAEYELRRTFGETDAINHRIYFRLTRAFTRELWNRR